MDPAIAATLTGVLCAALIGVLAGAFHLLRSDIRRVEGKLDGLVLRSPAQAISPRLTLRSPHRRQRSQRVRAASWIP